MSAAHTKRSRKTNDVFLICYDAEGPKETAHQISQLVKGLNLMAFIPARTWIVRCPRDVLETAFSTVELSEGSYVIASIDEVVSWGGVHSDYESNLEYLSG